VTASLSLDGSVLMVTVSNLGLVLVLIVPEVIPILFPELKIHCMSLFSNAKDRVPLSFLIVAIVPIDLIIPLNGITVF
jgi:hypothetical protein